MITSLGVHDGLIGYDKTDKESSENGAIRFIELQLYKYYKWSFV